MEANATINIGEFEELIAEAERLCDQCNREAQQIITLAGQIAMTTRNPGHLTLFNYWQAYYDCFFNRNYEQTINRSMDALKGFDAETYASIGYKPLMVLGNAYQLNGNFFSAQEIYVKGLRCLEAKSKLTHSEEVFIASFNYNLSTLLSDSELKFESEAYILAAIARYLKLDNKHQLSKCYVAYAKLFDMKGDFTNAVDYLYKAIEIDLDMQDEYNIAFSKAHLGILLIKINEYDKSMLYLKEVLDFYQTKNLAFETAMVKFEFGKAYIEGDEIETGLEFINSAEALMIDLGNRKKLTEIYKVKANIMLAKKDIDAAGWYQRKYIENIEFFFENERANALVRAKLGI